MRPVDRGMFCDDCLVTTCIDGDDVDYDNKWMGR